MSVIKMIIADDHHYISGEVYGSCAEKLYAACASKPASLDELQKLLPRFGLEDRLVQLFTPSSHLDLTPVDAGLIIVDLAKKWIFAEDNYFGAHRRGSYRTPDDAHCISYEFSAKWHFVAEAKWFNYLHSCELKNIRDQHTYPIESGTGTAHAYPTGQEHSSQAKAEWSPENPASLMASEPDDLGYQDEIGELWDEEMAGLEIEFANRWTALINFDPKNEAEEWDLRTLEHIIRYDQKVRIAEHQIRLSQKEKRRLQIELQAAENLWKRTSSPNWELKRIHLQARIDREDRRISRLTDGRSESVAMAAELRNLGRSGKFKEILEMWPDLP